MLTRLFNLRDWLAASLSLIRLCFEKLKIDYCCGGSQPLGQACARAGLEVEEVFRMLSQSGPAEDSSETLDSQSLALAELANYIVEKHHVFTRNALPLIPA